MISEKNTKQELLEEYKKLMAKAKASKKSVSSVRNMNTKNTKADILAEVRKLQEIFSQAARNTETGKNYNTTMNPSENVISISVQDEKPEESNHRKTENKSEKNKEADILAEIRKLQGIFSHAAKNTEEENDLIYLNQEIIEEINALTTAKAMKEDEYQKLCTAEDELRKFVVMINNSKNERAKLEEEHTLKEENLKAFIDTMTEKIQEINKQKLEQAEQSLKDTEEMIEADKKKITEERAVEEEKYTYEKTRKYLEEDDKWADEVAQREEKIQTVRKDTAALQAEIDAKAEHVKELTAKIGEIPELLEKAKQEAAEVKEKELNKEHGYKKHMAQKDADAAIQSLERQIANIKADYEAVLLEKNAIQDKLDKAYEESNKLYMQTVQSTGGIKILNSSDKN